MSKVLDGVCPRELLRISGIHVQLLQKLLALRAETNTRDGAETGLLEGGLPLRLLATL
jgi:hypothetical protein